VYGVKTGPAFWGVWGGVVCFVPWYLEKKKDLKAKYATHLEALPFKKKPIIIIIVHYQVIEFRFL